MDRQQRSRRLWIVFVLLAGVVVAVIALDPGQPRGKRVRETDRAPLWLLDRVEAPAEDRRHQPLGPISYDALARAVPSSFEVPVTLSEGSTLELAIGVEEGHPSPVRFEVLWRDAKGREIPLLEQSVTPGEQGRWLEPEVELDITGEGELVFRTGGEPSREEGDHSRPALWGCPVLDPRAGSDRPSFILVLLDTLRADHLGAYGYSEPTSPELDAIARRGSLFLRAYSQAPWTLPSTMSLFTSTYPAVHTVVSADRKLPNSVATLAQLLRHRGYRTAAFTEGGMVDSRMGFGKGFERYQNLYEGATAGETFDRAYDWIRRHAGEPYFAVVHTYQVHTPYHPPQDALAEIPPVSPGYDPHPVIARRFDSQWITAAPDRQPKEILEEMQSASASRPLTDLDLDHIVRLYDGEIRYTDECLGKLFRDLEALGEVEGNYLVVTSDHGEDFYDHFGFGFHGQSLFDELLHVPLFMMGPRIGVDQRIETPVALIDVAPTILELAGLPGGPGFQGTSLIELLLDPSDGDDDGPIFSQRDSYEMASLTGSRYKLIVADGWAKWTRQNLELQDRSIMAPLGLSIMPRFEDMEGVPADRMLFDLVLDPDERKNLVDELPDVSEKLLAELERIRSLCRKRAARDSSGHRIDPELEEQLRRLGYLGGEPPGR